MNLRNGWRRWNYGVRGQPVEGQAGRLGVYPIDSRESLKVFHQGSDMIKAVFRGHSGRVDWPWREGKIGA